MKPLIASGLTGFGVSDSDYLIAIDNNLFRR